jgi:hypothetical protein
MQMYLVAMVWTGALTLAQPGTAEPEFEDPAAKGSLFGFDHPRIPYPYEGVWADRPENCHALADRGVQVIISAGAIGHDRVALVEGYSDHSAVVVTLQGRRGKQRRVMLDISLDNQAIRIGEQVQDRSDLLYRCPPPPDGFAPENPDVRDLASEAERACKAKDFPRLFDAITRSRFVQRRYLARRILISDPSGSRSVTQSGFGVLPVRHDTYGYRLTTGSDWYTQLELEFREMEDRSIEVRWFERYPRSFAEGSALPGYLIFRRTRECWELSELNTCEPASDGGTPF